MMHYKLVIAFLALALSFLPAVSGAAQVQQERPEAASREEAQRSLQALQKMVTEQSYKELGFESPAEAKSAALGTPLRIFMVRLDQLREFEPKMDPNKLLLDTREVIYPVTVDRQVRSAVKLRQVEGKWQVVSFGRPLLIRALTQIAARQAEANRVPLESFFAVNIPALNLYFVGHRTGAQVWLTAVASEPRFNLQEGRTASADEIFSDLVPYAKRLKTGPYITD